MSNRPSNKNIRLDEREVLCEECGQCGRDNLVSVDQLEAFSARVLEHHGVAPQEAAITARVLVSADLRGIASHGVARLSLYIKAIQTGTIKPGVRFEVTELAPSMALLDAKNGLGQVASEMAMRLCIQKARQNGLGWISVKNSNHFGIAAYYVLMALEQNMIGLCMTNSAPLVIPTHGAKAVLGTNPIAFGAPAGQHGSFLMDMATSVVPRGKLEVYQRMQKQMPVGWAVDENGVDCQNPGRVLTNLTKRLGGGILPLGGRGEEFGGHKGYGLAMMADILAGVLSGSAFGLEVDNLRSKPNDQAAARVGHLFLALDISRFMPLDEFETRMEELIEQVRQAPNALDQQRIYIHGEKELMATERNRRCGIPLADKVYESLAQYAQSYGISPPPCLSGTSDQQP